MNVNVLKINHNNSFLNTIGAKIITLDHTSLVLYKWVGKLPTQMVDLYLQIRYLNPVGKHKNGNLVL
jgi:hypothetical protein